MRIVLKFTWAEAIALNHSLALWVGVQMSHVFCAHFSRRASTHAATHRSMFFKINTSNEDASIPSNLSLPSFERKTSLQKLTQCSLVVVAARLALKLASPHDQTLASCCLLGFVRWKAFNHLFVAKTGWHVSLFTHSVQVVICAPICPFSFTRFMKWSAIQRLLLIGFCTWCYLIVQSVVISWGVIVHRALLSSWLQENWIEILPRLYRCLKMMSGII